MRWRQHIALLSQNIRSMVTRVGTSLVAIVGIAGAVTLTISAIALHEGTKRLWILSGQDDVAIVIERRAANELMSVISESAATEIEQLPGISRDANGSVVSCELVINNVEIPASGLDDVGVYVSGRGVSARAFSVRPTEVSVNSGRWFRKGAYEVVVGRSLIERFQSLKIGHTVRIGDADLRIVGVLGAQGTFVESEVWLDKETLQGLMLGSKRQAVRQCCSSIRVKLSSPGAFEAFQAAVAHDNSLSLQTVSEKEFAAKESEMLIRSVNTAGLAISIATGLGATFAALNAMYAAIDSRKREIAVLKVLGFQPSSIIISVIAESVVLSVFGSIIGAIVSYFAVNNLSLSTYNDQVASIVAFRFFVSASAIWVGLAYGIFLGVITAIGPCIRATRISVAHGITGA
jgi:putative ABC transport system permease protein